MFEVNNAVSLEHIQTKEDVEKLLIAPLKKLNYMTYELNKNELVSFKRNCYYAIQGIAGK